MRIDSVSYKHVRIQDAFWTPKLDANRNATLPHGLDMLAKHGYESNFERSAARETGGFQGLVYQDSDVYKLLEAVAATLSATPDQALQSAYDRWIERIENAQEEDGYLNTHFQLKMPDKKWANLRDWHELYCAGHLIEAAVTDGGDGFLRIAVKLADHICERFGPGKTPGYPGHSELELALIKLAEATGEARYYDLARHFVNVRGSHYFATEHGTPEEEYDGTYWQDRVPLAEMDAIEGHAVRAVYLLCAATDIVRRSGDEGLEAMLHRIWDNVTQRRSYVTGGIGNSAKNEGFTVDYDLPNETAYQETCASIAMVFWAHRMALLYGDAKYIDVLENALYNGVLAGISEDGVRFFYENPLASSGEHPRKEWYACACCPPNIARLLATLGGVVYATGDRSVFINLFVAGSVASELDGEPFKVDVKTDYPWDGNVILTPTAGDGVNVCVRIPGWCDGFECKVGGELIEPRIENGYAVIEGDWNGKTTIEITFEMPVRCIRSHPNVAANHGRIAFARGPIVFCMEECDNPLSFAGYYVPEGASAQFDFARNAVIIEARWAEPGGDDLYRPNTDTHRATITAVPYFSWDNREPGRMQVWIPMYPPAY